MPKRTDIKSILIIGSGPIIIGQACEFDYSGTQACRALKEEGYRVILVNSNPATIMTDPEFADATYIEPITVEVVAKIIEKERPDALLPTLGGQTGLNTAMGLYKEGILDKFGVEMIGASPDAIEKAEDRELFKEAMAKIGLDLPKSGFARSMEEAKRVAGKIGFPVIIRPSFTLGGQGGGVAYNIEEFEEIASRGLDYSMISEILIEESVVGWKEYEFEVMRDKNDNVVIICSIENLDPMGVHTGDSITVAPAQTLTDKEYQKMRSASIAVIREIGVDTGGSNIQFAVNPKDGRMVVIEMNPRVSRSSALASKATGFPIARIAAKLAVGYSLDEIPNDITKETPASFEPVIDYCVVKIPRWAFEKFPGSAPVLTTSMKSVGETMTIGRTFKEALNKAVRSLEISRRGLLNDGSSMAKNISELTNEELLMKISSPNPERIFQIAEAFARGISIENVCEATEIDPWFLHNIKEIVDFEINEILPVNFEKVSPELLKKAKELGFSDKYLAHKWGVEESKVRERRKKARIGPVYKLVDTCSAEFEAYTPYFYSSYDFEDESRVGRREKVVILGGGPNRIGQGIEFDYCCVHASFALREMGYESIMVNSNPETVSTDYDTSDKLFFEPVTFEDVMNIIEKQKPYGIIVQLGGQTPLNISVALKNAGVRLLGTPAEAIDRAEDRDKFKAMLTKLGLKQPPNGIAVNYEQAKDIANRIGYPVLVRPSYVLGGRAMEIVYDEETLEHYMKEAVSVSEKRPVLIDRFLEDAIEVDVDLISDGKDAVIGGILEHIEYAGVHSGDSAMVLPPHSLGAGIIEEVRNATYALAKELGIIGLMNVQYAVKDENVYVIEVNPRASRTIPFISKAIGVPLAKLATKVMLGKSLKELGFIREVTPPYFAVKESVFPFSRFPNVDIILSPEMRSTGEVMGIDSDVGVAYLKSQLAAGQKLPTEGLVFISVRDVDKPGVLEIAKSLLEMGFEVICTKGTARYLQERGIDVKSVRRLAEGRPNTLDYIKNNEIKLIINTPSGRIPRKDEIRIRSMAIAYNIPCITTVAGAKASVDAIRRLKQGSLNVMSLQSRYSFPR